MLSDKELETLVRGCILNDRKSQKTLYSSFYSYAMSICSRYTATTDDATEVMNDGFLKIFIELHRFQPAYANKFASFKAWIRKIMTYTAIDHYRKNRKHKEVDDLDEAFLELPGKSENVIDKVSYDELLGVIKLLSPSYRQAVNLFIIDGFSHEEIAEHLGISVGASKSNLFKAKKQMQRILLNQFQIEKKHAF